MSVTGTRAAPAAALAAGTVLYRSLVTGRLTLDLGVGRRTRALGPLVVDIAAPPEAVFAAAAAPYAERRPRTLMEKVRILERTDQMVLAAHHTPDCGHRRDGHPGPPHRLAFRLVHGTGPYVVERFTLAPTFDPGSPTPASSAPTCAGSASSGGAWSPAAVRPPCTRH